MRTPADHLRIMVDEQGDVVRRTRQKADAEFLAGNVTSMRTYQVAAEQAVERQEALRAAVRALDALEFIAAEAVLRPGVDVADQLTRIRQRAAGM